MADYSRRVQEYLNKNNINVLFEEMMTKLVSEMPSEPVGFLIHSLQVKAEKMGLKPKGSQGEPGVTRSASQDLMRKTIAGDGAGVELGRERSYDKPWQAHSKKHRPSTSGGARSPTRPDWDHRTKVIASSFDNMRAGGGPTGTGESKTVLQSLLGALASAGPQSLDTQEVINTFLRIDEVSPPITDEDFLKGELSLIKEKKPVTATQDESKKGLTKKPKDQAQLAVNHKKELAKKIEDAKQQTQLDSGYEEERDVTHDDNAVELLENADDLIREGVKVSTATKRPARAAVSAPVIVQPIVPVPQIKVVICARCARVLDEAEQSSMPRAFAMAKDSDNDTDREQAVKPASYYPRPMTAGSAKGPLDPVDSDDEFESVSQVSGPRHPVWHDDRSGKESKGSKSARSKDSKHPKSSRQHASSGSDVGGGSKKGTTPRVTSTSMTVDMFLRGAGGAPAVAASHNTWSPSAVRDEDDEGTARYGTTGWATANIDDSDSSTYGISARPYSKDKRTY